MIDLEKEREAFEDAYQHHSFIKHVYRAGNHYSVMPNLNIAKDKKKIIVDLANSSWNAWQRCSLRAQEEITELKQKLEKLESGEFVLVPREPTKEFIIGLASGCFSEDGSPWLDPEQSYREMLSAIEAVESGKFNSDIQAMNKDLSNGVITGENFDNLSDDRSGGERHE